MMKQGNLEEDKNEWKWEVIEKAILPSLQESIKIQEKIIQYGRKFFKKDEVDINGNTDWIQSSISLEKY